MEIIKESGTVSVYDTQQKKLVMILSDYTVAAKYLFGETEFKSVWVRNFHRYIKNKRVNKTNSFKKKLTFRLSTNEQKSLLGDNDVAILDQAYIITQKMRLLNGHYIKIKIIKDGTNIEEVK